MTDAIPDRTILDIGESIGNSSKIQRLGLELGFTAERINQYRATNYMNGQVTSQGTINMLFDWRLSVRASEQREKLRQALNAAELAAIADEFL